MKQLKNMKTVHYDMIKTKSVAQELFQKNNIMSAQINFVQSMPWYFYVLQPFNFSQNPQIPQNKLRKSD